MYRIKGNYVTVTGALKQLLKTVFITIFFLTVPYFPDFCLKWEWTSKGTMWAVCSILIYTRENL